MRYLVKIFTLTDEDDAHVEAAIARGTLRDAERLKGFTQATTDEAGIEDLVARGPMSLSIEELVAPGPSRNLIKRFLDRALSLRTVGAGRTDEDADFEVERPDGERNYLLARMSGALTPDRRKMMAAADVRIVERWDGDSYVIKAGSAAALRTLDFLRDVVNYGATEILPETAAATELPELLREFEATILPDADVEAIAAAIVRDGGEVTSISAAAIRFAPSGVEPRLFAGIPGIARLQRTAPPVVMNDVACSTVGIRSKPTGGGFDGLDGSGQIVGIADTGIDEKHPDLIGRIVGIEALGRPGNHRDPDGHGTHVAGTVAGDGKASCGLLAGAAPAARIHFQSLLDANGRLGGLPPDVADLFSTAYSVGVRIHNNSWGAFLEARYGAGSIQVDRFVHGHPDFLPIIAAGNDGRCASSNERNRNSAVGFVELLSVATPASAKNGLTVGASRSARTVGGYSCMTWNAMWPGRFPDDPIASETVSGDAESLAAFSSRGPVENDVVKPDLVAPGTDVASTRSADAPLRNFWGAYPNNRAYAYMGGTSMAAPLVTGAAVLVRQYFVERRGRSPSAALVKAALVNGTTRLTGADAVAAPVGDPNYHQGFGRLDMCRTLPSDAYPGLRLEFVDTFGDPSLDLSDAGELRVWVATTDAAAELRFCLCWTDFPATSVQNSLLLLIEELGTGRRWASNQHVPQFLKMPSALPGGVIATRDPKNNVQVVRVPDAVAGAYRVGVVASNILFAPQSFALVGTGPIAAFAPA